MVDKVLFFNLYDMLVVSRRSVYTPIRCPVYLFIGQVKELEPGPYMLIRVILPGFNTLYGVGLRRAVAFWPSVSVVKLCSSGLNPSYQVNE